LFSTLVGREIIPVAWHGFYDEDAGSSLEARVWVHEKHGFLGSKFFYHLDFVGVFGATEKGGFIVLPAGDDVFWIVQGFGLADGEARRGTWEAGSPAGAGADDEGGEEEWWVVMTWTEEDWGWGETFGEEHWTPFGGGEGERLRVSMEMIFLWWAN